MQVSPTRRQFLAASAGIGAHLLEPLHRLEAAVRPVRITDVDVFRIEIPIPQEQVKQGRMNRYVVCRIDTSVGVRGYSFAGPDPKILDTFLEILKTTELFKIEQGIVHLPELPGLGIDLDEDAIKEYRKDG